MNILTIVLHHTATPGHGTGGSEWEAIQQACQAKRGGEYVCDYHWGVGPTGDLFPGQPESKPSWHCGVDAINNTSLGIACIGNFEENPMPSLQFDRLAQLVKSIKQKYPKAVIKLHREIVPTLCPGKLYPNQKLFDSLQPPIPKPSKVFHDILPNHIFYPAIIALVSRGIMNGDSEGTFRPDDPVTRGELAQVIWNIVRK